jgi:hypothetical protein
MPKLRKSHRIMSLVDEEIIGGGAEGVESVDNEPDDLALQRARGSKNEELVNEALKLLRHSRKIFSFYKTVPYGELDTMGTDFLIFPDSLGWSIHLQVKSSEEGRIKHERHAGAYGIPCVVIGPISIEVSELSQIILREIGLDTSGLEDHIRSIRSEELIKKISESLGQSDTEE